MNSVKMRDDTDNTQDRPETAREWSRAEREKRGGDGELNMGRREGAIYFKLGTQESVNRRRDWKGH